MSVSSVSAVAYVKCRMLKSPTTQRETGLMRYVAAVPNLAGLPDSAGDPQPCFTGKYHIWSSSDKPCEELSAQYFESFKAELARRGYDTIEFWD